MSEGTGDLVGGRYRLARMLGSGSEGTVWLAHDSRRAIDVALKVLHPRHAASKKTLSRFLAEAELCQRMLSPHIVKVLERGVSEAGVPYTVYEHLEGEDLAARLARARPLSFADVRLVVLQTCRALARAHAIGVLHRDVKPENLFVTTDEQGRFHLKVVDFGVAQVLGDDVTERPLVGTLEYIAPEVLLAESEADVRSDLYSLGVVAYECVTGHVPFHAENVGQLVLALSRGERPRLAGERSDAPPKLAPWFDRALARDPKDRFESARDAAESLHEALRPLRKAPKSPSPTTPASVRERAASFDFDDDSASARYSIIRPSEK